MIAELPNREVVFASDASITIEDVVTSSRFFEFETVANLGMLEMPKSNFHAQSLENCVRVSSVNLSRWDAQNKSRFKELSRREAMGSLNTTELEELEMLSSLRRANNFPRSAEEILWQRRQSKLTRTLVDALQEYVKFHEPTSGAQA